MHENVKKNYLSSAGRESRGNKNYKKEIIVGVAISSQTVNSLSDQVHTRKTKGNIPGHYSLLLSH